MMGTPSAWFQLLVSLPIFSETEPWRLKLSGAHEPACWCMNTLFQTLWQFYCKNTWLKRQQLQSWKLFSFIFSKYQAVLDYQSLFEQQRALLRHVSFGSYSLRVLFCMSACMWTYNEAALLSNRGIRNAEGHGGSRAGDWGWFPPSLQQRSNSIHPLFICLLHFPLRPCKDGELLLWFRTASSLGQNRPHE